MIAFRGLWVVDEHSGVVLFSKRFPSVELRHVKIVAAMADAAAAAAAAASPAEETAADANDRATTPQRPNAVGSVPPPQLPLTPGVSIVKKGGLQHLDAMGGSHRLPPQWASLPANDQDIIPALLRWRRHTNATSLRSSLVGPFLPVDLAASLHPSVALLGDRSSPVVGVTTAAVGTDAANPKLDASAAWSPPHGAATTKAPSSSAGWSGLYSAASGLVGPFLVRPMAAYSSPPSPSSSSAASLASLVDDPHGADGSHALPLPSSDTPAALAGCFDSLLLVGLPLVVHVEGAATQLLPLGVPLGMMAAAAATQLGQQQQEEVSDASPAVMGLVPCLSVCEAILEDALAPYVDTVAVLRPPPPSEAPGLAESNGSSGPRSHHLPCSSDHSDGDEGNNSRGTSPKKRPSGLLESIRERAASARRLRVAPQMAGAPGPAFAVDRRCPLPPLKVPAKAWQGALHTFVALAMPFGGVPVVPLSGGGGGDVGGWAPPPSPAVVAAVSGHSPQPSAVGPPSPSPCSTAYPLLSAAVPAETALDALPRAPLLPSALVLCSAFDTREPDADPASDMMTIDAPVTPRANNTTTTASASHAAASATPYVVRMVEEVSAQLYGRRDTPDRVAVVGRVSAALHPSRWPAAASPPSLPASNALPRGNSAAVVSGVGIVAVPPLAIPVTFVVLGVETNAAAVVVERCVQTLLPRTVILSGGGGGGGVGSSAGKSGKRLTFTASAAGAHAAEVVSLHALVMHPPSSVGDGGDDGSGGAFVVAQQQQGSARGEPSSSPGHLNGSDQHTTRSSGPPNAAARSSQKKDVQEGKSTQFVRPLYVQAMLPPPPASGPLANGASGANPTATLPGRGVPLFQPSHTLLLLPSALNSHSRSVVGSNGTSAGATPAVHRVFDARLEVRPVPPSADSPQLPRDRYLVQFDLQLVLSLQCVAANVTNQRQDIIVTPRDAAAGIDDTTPAAATLLGPSHPLCGAVAHTTAPPTVCPKASLEHLVATVQFHDGVKIVPGTTVLLPALSADGKSEIAAPCVQAVTQTAPDALQWMVVAPSSLLQAPLPAGNNRGSVSHRRVPAGVAVGPIGGMRHGAEWALRGTCVVDGWGSSNRQGGGGNGGGNGDPYGSGSGPTVCYRDPATQAAVTAPVPLASAILDFGLAVDRPVLLPCHLLDTDAFADATAMADAACPLGAGVARANAAVDTSIVIRSSSSGSGRDGGGGYVVWNALHGGGYHIERTS